MTNERARPQPTTRRCWTPSSRLWQQVDPPPDDLADGVLARIAAEDLEFDLLTLVESDGALAGVRSAAVAEEDATRSAPGRWSTSAPTSASTSGSPGSRTAPGSTAGWCRRGPHRAAARRGPGRSRRETPIDEFGRFEFARRPPGLCRLSFLDEPRTSRPARVTPPFWI